MDEGVKALVEFFNERGLTTHMTLSRKTKYVYVLDLF